MSGENFSKKLLSILKNDDIRSFNDEKEYYFSLGQILSAVFTKIGGYDKYRKEFNYLTNPYLPISINDLGIRIIKFLEKAPKLFKSKDMTFDKIYNLLLQEQALYLDEKINNVVCEEAFYEGLYSKNVFL